MRLSMAYVTVLSTLLQLLTPGSHEVYSQQNPNHTFNISTENGVLIAENSGGPKYSDRLFIFEKVLELRPDPENQSSYLYRPSDFVLGDDGYYFVEDNGNQRIAVFTPDGEYQRSFGQEGSGPGEFQNIKIELLSEDRLQLFDQFLIGIDKDIVFRQLDYLLDLTADELLVDFIDCQVDYPVEVA